MESGWIERTFSSNCLREEVTENERERGRRDVLFDGQVALRAGKKTSRIILDRLKMRNRLSSMGSNYNKPAKSSNM